MKVIPLSALPNQRVAFNVDGAFWQIHVYMALTSMCADITRNGENVINGIRCDKGLPLLPYGYMMEPNFGNFVFDSDVDWEKLGTECNLNYLSYDEFQAYKTALMMPGDI